MSTNISFKKVTHRPAKVATVLSHCKPHPILSIFNISRHFFLVTTRNSTRNGSTHTYVVKHCVPRSRRTTCTHFSCSRQRRDYYQTTIHARTNLMCERSRGRLPATVYLDIERRSNDQDLRTGVLIRG